MKAKAELKKAIDVTKQNLLTLFEAGNITEAKTVSDELEQMIAKYKAMPSESTAERKVKTMDKSLLKSAVNAYLHKGWNGMSDEEKAIVRPMNSTDSTGQVETVSTRGGVFVNSEVADYAERMDTGVYRLRDRVSQYFAKTLSGKIPLANNPTAGLVAQFDELPASGISKGHITFGAVEWTVKDYGLIVPVSNDLLADAEADVFGIIAEQFNRAQVITENSMILTAIDGIGAATAITDWKDILKAINAVAPVGGTDKVIITNTDGFNYLDTLVDENEHPILTQALVDNPKRIFRGYEVIQLPNAILATDSTTGAIPFYVASLKDAVVFVERKGLEIAYNPYSDSAYSKNATDVRVTCRLDCKVKFADAAKKLEYTPE